MLSACSVRVAMLCVNRAAGPGGGGHGPNQPGYEGRREEPRRHGEVLRPLCPAMEEVRLNINVLTNDLSDHLK